VINLEKKKVEESVEEVKIASFSKQQLIGSKKYKSKRDVLNVVLENDQKYTLDEVDDLIQKFNNMKG